MSTDMTEDEPPLPGTAVMKRSAGDIVAKLAADLASVRAESVSRKQKLHLRKCLAGLVFAYWVAKFDHPRALLDRKREVRIMTRLEECGDNVSDLLYCLDGASKDPWVRGTDPKAPRAYDGLETIFRDREQIEKFAERTKGYRESRVHKMAEKYIGGSVEDAS